MTESRTSPMDALLDAYSAQRRALRRVLRFVAEHPDHLAKDPAFILKAVDADRASSVCPPGCTGTCTPHPDIAARLNTIALTQEGE
ncbi:hypothetical protein ACFUEN_29115 [Streptomyces griseorubiginosus]|uniref:hypothetical protein n=1 Tax=Streptomyces griseorubiginosus TaxID=67304 RepID=UPI003638CD4B